MVRSDRSGSSWIAGFLRQLYRWEHAQWKARNDCIHKKDSEARAVKLMSDTDQKIVNEFTLGFSGLRAIDHYVFSGVTVEDMLQKSQEDKINWLRQLTAVRKRTKTAEATQMDCMRQFMERWKKRKK